MKTMSLQDKAILALLNYGYTIAEATTLMELAKQTECVHIDIAKDQVIWVADYDNEIWVTRWPNYKKGFCHNFEFCGAILLEQYEAEMTDEDRADFKAFFKQCHETYNAPMPELADHLQWIFTDAATTDWLDNDQLHIYESTDIDITINE